MGRFSDWWNAARAESRRRRTEHDNTVAARALEQWEREAAELIAARDAAAVFVGRGAGEVPASNLTLKRGERLFLTVGKASLVEHRRGAGHWASGYSGFSVRLTRGLRWNVGASRGHYVPGPESPTVVDVGEVTITDRRVVFQGAKKSREWAFSKLLGYQHLDEAPISLLHVSNRQNVSGIGYDAATAGMFQLRLAIAVADATGTRDRLVGELQRELEEHWATRPMAPSVQSPTSAAAPPAAAAVAGRAFASYRRWPAWGQVAAPIFAVGLVLAGLGSDGDDDRETATRQTPAGAVVEDTTTDVTETQTAVVEDEPSTTTTELTTTTTVAPTTTLPPTTAPPTTAPPPPPTTVPPPPPPTAPPATVAQASGCHPSYDPCVPVASDVDCAGGSGNGPEYTGRVSVIGPDVYDLDRDGDGTGCD